MLMAGDNAILPVTPTLTPALAIAGVILLVSGLFYGLVGIESKTYGGRLHDLTKRKLTMHQALHILFNRLFVKSRRDCTYDVQFRKARLTSSRC